MTKNERADLFLVARGYAKSRAEAQAAIAAGHVAVDGVALTKPAQRLRDNAHIAYAPAHPYVSRAGAKLAAALDRFALSPKGRLCMDLGTSTGGFTQVLLERGALRVHAIDVGHGQLVPALAADPRVVLHEGVNARSLDAQIVAEPVHTITADLSFIGLEMALPPALALAAPGAWLVALIKPQFEVGRAAVGKGGVVRDRVAREAALARLTQWISSVDGWRVRGTMKSPIAGADGNVEYLLGAVKG